MKKHQFKILSIDGGGIRGVIPCTILKEIEKRTQRHSSELFDLMAGTSTGAIIALGLATPSFENNPLKKYEFDAKKMLKFYEDHGKDIFKKRKFHDILSYLIVAYEVDDLFELLQSKFKGIELKDILTHTNLLVTAFDSAEGSPFLFKSRLAKIVEPNSEKAFKENPPLFKIARATSAAPTFFEPYQDSDSVFLDGGVFANNPSVLAYIEAKEIWKLSEQNKSKDYVIPSKKGVKTDILPYNDDLPFFMLSLGTGGLKKTLNYSESKNMGKLQWAKPVIEIMMQGVSDKTDYEMRHLLPEYLDTNKTKRYMRINPSIDDSLKKMDEAKNFKELESVAKKYIEEHDDEIEEICNNLMN
jgi:uncharacterized protein